MLIAQSINTERVSCNLLKQSYTIRFQCSFVNPACINLIKVLLFPYLWPDELNLKWLQKSEMQILYVCKLEILTSSLCTRRSHVTSPHEPLGNLVFRPIVPREIFQTLKETKFKILCLVQERSPDNKLKTMISKDLSHFDKKNKTKSNWSSTTACAFCYLLKALKGFGSLWNLSNRLRESMYTVVLVHPRTKRELTRGNFFKYHERSVNTWIPNSSSICPVKPFCLAISNDTEPIAACIRGKQINSSINSDYTDKNVSVASKD